MPNFRPAQRPGERRDLSIGEIGPLSGRGIICASLGTALAFLLSVSSVFRSPAAHYLHHGNPRTGQLCPARERPRLPSRCAGAPEIGSCGGASDRVADTEIEKPRCLATGLDPGLLVQPGTSSAAVPSKASAPRGWRFPLPAMSGAVPCTARIMACLPPDTMMGQRRHRRRARRPGRTGWRQRDWWWRRAGIDFAVCRHFAFFPRPQHEQTRRGVAVSLG